MGVMKRVTMIFRSKANKALDRMEDPRETLDYSYQRQLELLTKVRRGVADVATSRKRIELQMNQLHGRQNQLDKQARDALAAGREDLAREALTRKSSVQTQIDGLQQQYASLQGEEEKLTRASQGLQAKVESFRAQKETIKASYTAAEAQTRIGEAFSGISEEMGDVGMAVQRAEDKTAQMQARAGAIDELLASGALDDVTGPPRDDIQAELDRMGASSDVELELAKLKGQLGEGEAQRQIEGTQSAAQGQASSAAAQQPSNGPTSPAPPGPEPQNPAGEGT
jgi:phage shock protein A